MAGLETRDLAPVSGGGTRLTRPCVSNTRTCHLRAGGSCTKLTALPLRVVAAAPAGSGRDDLRLYRLEHDSLTVVRPTVNPVAAPLLAVGSTQRQSTCTA